MTGGKPASGPPPPIWSRLGLRVLVLVVIAAPLDVLLGLISLLMSAGGRYVQWRAITTIVVGSVVSVVIAVVPWLFLIAAEHGRRGVHLLRS